MFITTDAIGPATTNKDAPIVPVSVTEYTNNANRKDGIPIAIEIMDCSPETVPNKMRV